MPALRSALAQAGFENVRTYLQSGNVVVDAGLAPPQVETTVAGIIEAEFGLRIAVVTRTGRDLARIVSANPLAEHAEDPKRYQVSFLSGELSPEVVARLTALATPPERLVVHPREIYAWHPGGVARSKLWNGLAGNGLGVTATARNWTTVLALLALAEE
jgi:uncharacterized protein (DUF1697 family)